MSDLRRKRSHRLAALGFTLIEILVVLAIVGVVVTMAAVRFGPHDEDIVQREAERLALLFETARDEAIAGGTALAFSQEGMGYRFMLQSEDGLWHALNNNEALRPRALPERVRLSELRVNLQVLPPGGRIVFTPSGVNAPFSALLQLDGLKRELQADALGRITVLQPAPMQGGTP